MPDDLADRYGVESKDVAILAAVGRHLWDEMRGHFPNPESEKELKAYWTVGSYSLEEDVMLTGHIDVLSVPDDMARVLDHKSGWLDTDADDQMRGYALLVFENYPAVKQVWVGVLRLRDKTVDGRTYEREEITAWWQRLLASVQGPERFNPSEVACRYCQRAIECPAKTAILQQAAAALMPGQPLQLTPDAIGQVFDRVRLLENALETARDMIKAEVVARGGLLPIGGGRALQVTEEKRSSITFNAAKPVLDKHLDADAIGRCVTLGKTKLLDEVRAAAPSGSKKTAAAEVMAELEEAGAIETTTFLKLGAKRHADHAIETTGSGAGSQR